MGDGAVLVPLIKMVCKGLDLSYALLKLHSNLRKCLQKPLPILQGFFGACVFLPRLYLL
jgi:hypothetical protein